MESILRPSVKLSGKGTRRTSSRRSKDSCCKEGFIVSANGPMPQSSGKRMAVQRELKSEQIELKTAAENNRRCPKD